MEEELAFADSDPLSACSNSSLLPHCSSGELFEESQELKSPPSENRNVARTNKLLQKYNMIIPDLKVKSLETRIEAVDLALPNEKLDPWLSRKFPLMKKRQIHDKHAESNVKKGISAQQNIKKELLARMAVRRKVEQQRRKQLYIEDNEDVFGDNGTEDDDEIILKKKEKTKLKAPKPTESDNSEDDDDYVAEEEDEGDSESSSNENGNEDDDVVNDSVHSAAEEAKDNLPLSSFKESIDIFGSQSPPKTFSLESAKNIFSPNSPPAHINIPSQFPSFSQWYTSGSDKMKSSKESDDELSDELNITVANEPVNNDDLLMFCSGQFDIPAEKLPETTNIPQQLVEVTEENDDRIKRTQRKTRRLVESDDEDETPVEQNIELLQEHVNDVDDPSEDKGGVRKAVLLSDDEHEEYSTPSPQDLEIAEDGVEELEEEISDEEKQETDKESGEEADENDSDNELAVIRRLEKKEHKRKLRKGKFLDDEASLSGSDVGSDIDEDGDSNDEYELDECDKEQFDEEEIRNKNHKLFLKQQQQQVHREIAKLQDRLLADGDLAGVETNRTFRVQLREDVFVDMNELNDCSQDDLPDDDNFEEDKKRSDAIKFRAERHNIMQSEDVPVDDDIERAANAASLTEVSEELSQAFTLPTLIGKTPLAAVFKDINGSLATRQMFTNTTELVTGKRIYEAHPGQPKRPKLTVFDSLDV